MSHHPESIDKSTPASRACPVCGGNEAAEIHRHRFVLFDGHPLAGECVTAVCERCGMGFNRATAPEEAYRRHYTELSKYATSVSPLAGAGRFAVLADIIARQCPDRSLPASRSRRAYTPRTRASRQRISSWEQTKCDGRAGKNLNCPKEIP